ncbi:hypothetical protein [Lonsdalea quercina]|uniref:hypothetical protein n=1 Tax=Lonsdalea quercina TaxID=71657 RepID=UPI0039759787
MWRKQGKFQRQTKPTAGVSPDSQKMKLSHSLFIPLFALDAGEAIRLARLRSDIMQD